MKHTVRRALAVLIAMLLALPTFALAEAPTGVEAPIEERVTYLGDDDGLTVVEEPAPAELPDADDDGELIEDDDTVESVDEVDGMLTAAGFVAQSDIPEGKFAVDFVCDAEGAAITVYPADGDEAIPAETGNLWYLAPGDYTYVAQAGDVTAQDSFTVTDADVTLWVSLAAEEAETLDENGEALMSVATTTYYLYYASEADAIAGRATQVDDVTATILTSRDYRWSTGVYVVDADVTIGDRIYVDGDAHLILCDGCTLTVHGGINVSLGNSLTIYGQQNGTGELVITDVNNYCAGIGSGLWSRGGDITIHGGIITVTGGASGAGIGSGQSGVGGTITINGGKVNATGGVMVDCAGAGIGGGDSSNGGTITINGGTVVAIGVESNGYYSAGIGGGENGAGGDITINGGSVTATGGSAAAKGIGGGWYADDGTLTLGDGVTLQTSGDGTAWSEYTDTRAQYMRTTPVSAPVTYTVTLSGGGNATASGGDTTQEDLTGAMTNVVYTPNTGYHFVENDFVGIPDNGANGVTAIFDSTTGTVTVSGTPTADVALEIPGAVEDAAVTTVEVRYLYYASEADAIAGTASSDTVEATVVTGSDNGWSDGWYVVNEIVTNNNRINVDGDVHLILADGCTLTASAGITVEGNNSLTIYGQSGDTGALTIPEGLVGSGYAGIGSYDENGGSITINGGDISVTGGDMGGAGIGGGVYCGGGTIIINGGKVNATGGMKYSYAGAGIGGGSWANSNSAFTSITINGGTVVANGVESQGYSSAGIGSGNGGKGVTITINGGSVTATGGDADAMGIGDGDNAFDDNGTLTLGRGVKLETSDDNTNWTVAEDTGTRAQYMKTTYSLPGVTLTGGANATTSGGNTTQTGLTGAMTTVTYTPSEGYCFEAFDAIADHGITVSYDATTGNVIVSGTPTADVAIVIPDAVPCYAVNLTGGRNATTSGGDTTQTGLTGAMTDVVYTAEDSYHFVDFSDITVNGITVTRTNDTTVTVSGTPTSNTTIVVPDALSNNAQVFTISGLTSYETISGSFRIYTRLQSSGGVCCSGEYPATITAADGVTILRVEYTLTNGGRVSNETTANNGTVSASGDNVTIYNINKPSVVISNNSDVRFIQFKSVTIYYEGTPCCSVTLTGGGHATPSGGSTSQTNVTGAMTDVVYTAEKDYHFDDFSAITVNGITVTRISDTTVTVSGTPTYNTTIAVPNAQHNNDQAVTISGLTSYETIKDGFRISSGHADQDGINCSNKYPATITAADGVTILRVEYTLSYGGRYSATTTANPGTVSASGDNVTINDINASSVEISNSDSSSSFIQFKSVTIYYEGTPSGYSVTLNGGGNATTSGGSTSQTNVTGAMTEVVYTAEEDYHFDDFSDITVNGITVTRISNTTVTVSGTPTSNTTIAVPDAVADGFTVTFDTSGGSDAPAAQTVAAGGKATAPDDPTNGDKKFLGWFAPNATTAFDFDNTTIDADLTLTAHWADAVAVTATITDTNGDVLSGSVTGAGTYYDGDSVTLTAPKISGYNFVGWFAEGGAQNLCADRAYTFTVGATTAFVAKYTALPTALITIKGGGHTFLVNGVEQSDTYQWSCQIGTTVTIQSQEDSFAYWMNSYGMQLTTKKTYSFTVTSAETITAEYNTIIDGKAKVIFESYYGQVIAQRQFAEGDDEALPALPTRKGYTTLGWDCDGNGAYDAQKDTLSAAISRGLDSTNTSKTVTVLAVYQLIDTTYTIKVVDGTGSGSYMENTKITVEADAPASGQKFSHWKDSEGTILGYETTYTFYAVKDMTLTAVYVNDTVSVEAVGTTVMEAITKDTTNNKLIFVTMSTVPEGCVIQMAGIIATNVAEVGTSGDGFNDTTAAFVRAGTPKGRTLEYTWTKSKVNTGDVWYARAYLVYTNVNGNTCTIYGPMVSITY